MITACRYAYPIDKGRTLDRTGQAGLNPLNERITLKTLVITCKMVVITLIMTWSFGVISAHSAVADSSPNQINAYRVYAHERIFNFDQFICFDKLIVRESHYNDVATNGNHYGLAQGIYKPLLRMSGYQQIDWAIAYIQRRYTNACNALKHSYRYGWY